MTRLQKQILVRCGDGTKPLFPELQDEREYSDWRTALAWLQKKKFINEWTHLTDEGMKKYHSIVEGMPAQEARRA
jgi:hypothetical protein